MDQNVKLKEAVNSSFSNIYDYLAIIDSELNYEVINSINNNSDPNAFPKLQVFKDKYIKTIQATKNLQLMVLDLVSFNEKDFEEIKSNLAAMENVEENELVNESVQPVEEAVAEDTAEVENENVEMPEEEVAVEQDFGIPQINETPVESEEAVVEENTVNEEQPMVEETAEVQEQPIEENEAEISEDTSEVTEEAPVEAEVTNEENNDQEIVIPSVSDAPVEEAPTEEAVAEEETPTEEVANEESNDQEIVIPSVSDAPVEEEAPAQEAVAEEEAPVEEASNEESNDQEIVIPSVSDAPAEEETPVEEENAEVETTNEESNENEPVIPLVGDSTPEENATEEEPPVEISFDGVNQDEPNNVQQDGTVLPVVEPTEEEDKNDSDDVVLHKTSNDPVKAILTTNPQYGNLGQSRETNKAQLSAKGILGKKENTISDDNVEEEAMKNGLVEESIESLQKQYQELVEKAQTLYKEGDAPGAQELMKQVAVLNEKINNLTKSSNEEEKQFQLTA